MAAADASDTTMNSQSDRMPGVEAARWSVSPVPTRRPFTGVVIKRRSVEPQPGNDCEAVTFARVDRDPSSGAALAVAAKFCCAHWQADAAPAGKTCYGAVPGRE